MYEKKGKVKKHLIIFYIASLKKNQAVNVKLWKLWKMCENIVQISCKISNSVKILYKYNATYDAV